MWDRYPMSTKKPGTTAGLIEQKEGCGFVQLDDHAAGELLTAVLRSGLPWLPTATVSERPLGRGQNSHTRTI